MAEAIAERSPGGRYIRFCEKLGSGASKDVFRAYDTQEGIEVAWNVVNISGVPKSERNRIVGEVRLLERLHHHNIISFHGSWVNRVKQEVHFVTEILSSGTLKSFIRRVQVIRWKIAKRWAYQILKGLEYLHSQGVIHRDLKCDNIFINGTSGDLRIGDLGLSTVHRDGGVLSVLGTPEFMAPDMYEEKSYDERVDIYSFGMCMLEIFTKEIPYNECQNPAQIYRKVSKGHLPLSLGRIQNLEAREFIMQCLGYKDPRTGQYIRPTASQLLNHEFLLKAQDDQWVVSVDPPMYSVAEDAAKAASNVYEPSEDDPLALQQQMEYRAQQDDKNERPPPGTSNEAEYSSSDEGADDLMTMPQNEGNFRDITVLGGRGKESDYKPDDQKPQGKQVQHRQEQEQRQSNQMEELKQVQREKQAELSADQYNQAQLLQQQQDQELQELKARQLKQHEDQRAFQLQQQQNLQEKQVLELRSQRQQQLQQQSLRIHPAQKPQPGQQFQQQQQPQLQGLQLQQQQQQIQLQQQMEQLQLQQLQLQQQMQQNQGSHGSASRGSHPSQNSHPSYTSQQQQIAAESYQPGGSYGSKVSHGSHTSSHDSHGSHPSQGSSVSRKKYLTAAAVVEDDDLVADQQFADNYLKLIITLPIHGQTQSIQFDFHLVEDDPTQIATEMVEELGIPQPAILEISETISGLARVARLRRDATYANEQQEQLQQQHKHTTSM